MTDSDDCVSLTNIIYMKQPAKIDVAVLMLFFNRPDNFQKVFDEVKKARPAKLFLYQDGARGERDVPGIEAWKMTMCRASPFSLSARRCSTAMSTMNASP